jgi:hypothetical protein
MRRLPGLLIVGLTAATAGATLAQDAASPGLPLRDVVLFSSGVGYFQRQGTVNGSTTVDLAFRAEKVNDILKSLVVLDPGGAVRPVTYTTADATNNRLAAVGKALNQNVSLGSLLRQLQGARVRLTQSGGQQVEGRIVSVSVKAIPVKDAGIVQTDVLNVLTPDGLQALPLEQISQVKLLDEKLDRELRESLELLATGLDEQRKSVQLKFTGNGAREVKAGYLQETPVWKTSYRLVLDKTEKPYLQGWAIVENTTDEDWKDVHLSLVSGRPISFIQDLYQPLYIPRPVVQAQVIGSPLPQTYNDALFFDMERKVVGQPGGGMGGFGGAGLGLAPATASPPGPQGPAGPRGAATESELRDLRRNRAMVREEAAMSAKQMAQSVASEADTAQKGDLFEYAIKQPLTLPRQQAAMVPIVSERIEGEKLSIYDPDSDVKHALHGFRLLNTTGLHLSGGPVTVFQAGNYAGDAQITHLQPKEDRLLSYAVDLDLVADHEQPKFRQDTVSVSAKSGVLVITRKQQREHVYTFRNKSDEAKTVLVQQNLEPEFKLVTPEKPAEKTAEEYRFKVEVPAKKSADLKVVTERPVSETIALLNADLNLLISYAQNAQVSEKLRSALKQLVVLRRKVTEIQAQRATLEGELKSIDAEQSRIRQNMAQLDRNSPLYQQYVKKLTDQETRIEKIREEIARLRDAETAAQKEVREYVDTLTVS